MKSRIFVSLAIAAAAVCSIGCGGAANTSNTAANTATLTNANTAPKEETTNTAPTLTPVFKAYCEAMVKKDEAGLRKVYSADTLKYFEQEMKEEKIPNLIKYLEDEQISGKLCEVRNEVITGEKAVAEIRADPYPNGIKIEFVKEGGEWKITNRSPAVGDKPKDNEPAKPAANAPAKN
jgi:hypothetical protein